MPGGNQRRYDDRSVNTLRFIRHARALGFEIAQIRELLTRAAHPERPCAGADALARLDLDHVERRIAILQSLRGELRRTLRQRSGSRVATCPVIEVLRSRTLPRRAWSSGGLDVQGWSRSLAI